MKHRTNKLLSILLALVMLLGLLPMTALAAPGIPDARIMPGVTPIDDPVAKPGQEAYYAPSDYLYFGVENGTPIKWRVLDADRRNDGGPGMFLMSEHVMSAAMVLNHVAPANRWQGSEVQKWCREFAGEEETANTSLGKWERQLLVPVSKVDRELSAYGYTCLGGNLLNEKVFIPSLEEMMRYVGPQGKPGWAATEAWEELCSVYWLRTAINHYGPDTYAASVTPHGIVDPIDALLAAVGIRVACNLNPESILFTSDAEGKPDDIGPALRPLSIGAEPITEWKLTLQDWKHLGSRFYAEGGDPGKINYYNAVTGPNEYLSAIVRDDRTGGYTHYARLAYLGTPTMASGEVDIDLYGVDMRGKTLYIFNEQCNGARRTDYAGELVECIADMPPLKALESIAVSVTPPVTGQKPDRNARVPAGAGYTAQPVVWYRRGSNTPMSDTDTFQNDTAYRVHIQIDAKPGYEIRESVHRSHTTVNGAHATCDVHNNQSAMLRYEFYPTDKSKISYVSVSGIQPPTAGKMPDMTFEIPGGVNYAKDTESGLDFVIWHNMGTGREHQSAFEEDTVYRATVFLDAKQGYEFASRDKLTAQINGSTAVVENDQGEFIEISYTFPRTEKSHCTIRVTASPSEGGTVTGGGTYLKNTAVTVRAVPKPGYHFVEWRKDGRSYLKAEVFELHASSDVTLTAVFQKDGAQAPTFIDVPPNAYYADAVRWAVQNGVTSGFGPTTFAPELACTRAQAVAFLWRAHGCPEPHSHQLPFADVSPNAYYAKAVLWAVENQVAAGTGGGTFSPDEYCTRAQIVSFLWRSFHQPVISAPNPFTDVPANAYYTGAVLWAVGKGVAAGTGPNTFSPDQFCTRAQIVSFLYRAMG